MEHYRAFLMERWSGRFALLIAAAVVIGLGWSKSNIVLPVTMCTS